MDTGSILVLDDDFDINNIVKLALRNHGYNVFGFTDPLLALEHFKSNHSTYSLVLSDLRMPVMNGIHKTSSKTEDRWVYPKANINKKIEWYYR